MRERAPGIVVQAVARNHDGAGRRRSPRRVALDPDLTRIPVRAESIRGALGEPLVRRAFKGEGL